MRQLVLTSTICCCLLALAACRPAAVKPAGPQPVNKVYDKTTGRLVRLDYDTRNSGQIDTRCFMDGTRLLRTEIDTDGDGKVDRWEYYGPDQKIEKVGFSRQNDGVADAWAYPAPDGSIARIEISIRRDGKVNRVEYYEGSKLVRAEEDTTGAGRPDKWETYKDGRLQSVSLDTARTGKPDRKLTYLADGRVITEELK